MTWVTLGLSLVYHAIFALYYKTLFPARGRRWIIAFILTFALMAAVNIVTELQGLSILHLSVSAIIMMAGLRGITSMNGLQAMYGGIVSVLSAYCVHGLFVSIGALLLRRPLVVDTVYCAFASAGLLAGLLLFLFLRRNIFADQKIKMLLYNPSQLKLVIGYGIAAIGDLTIMRSGRYIPQHDVWYPAVVFANYALTFGVLLFAIHQSIRGADFLIDQERSRMLEEQYASQLGHYKSYEKHTQSFRAFRHDYRAMMAVVKSLMRTGEIEQAAQLIDDVHDSAQKQVQIHKKYSDNVVLDVMLQDLANLCDENEIRYSFRVHVPQNTGLTLLDGIRVFSNLTTNAVEACKKLPSSERYIRIASSTDGEWAVLEIANPFDGGMTFRKGMPVTTKAEPEAHGLGLGIVREIIEAIGGVVFYDVENKTFSARIFIPQASESPASSL